MNKDFEWCLQRGEVENLGMEETKERIKRKRVSFRALWLYVRERKREKQERVCLCVRQ
jgi:lipoprotein NlpI